MCWFTLQFAKNETWKSTRNFRSLSPTVPEMSGKFAINLKSHNTEGNRGHEWWSWWRIFKIPLNSRADEDGSQQSLCSRKQGCSKWQTLCESREVTGSRRESALQGGSPLETVWQESWMNAFPQVLQESQTGQRRTVNGWEWRQEGQWKVISTYSISRTKSASTRRVAGQLKECVEHKEATTTRGISSITCSRSEA